MATAVTQEPAQATPDRIESAPAPARPDKPARPSSSRRRIIIPIVALLLLAGLGWAVGRWSYARSHESTDNAQIDGHIVPILAKVGGYVQAVAVDENQHVVEGAVVARIDSSEYVTRLAQANADLAAAQAAVGGRGATGQAEAAVQTASSQSAASSAQVAAARANYERAASDLQRARALASKQIISQAALDAAQANADAQRANYIAVQRQASAAGASVVNAQAGVRLARARLAAAQAARDNAALQLSYAKVTVPEAGVVTRKQIEVGQLVQPGQTLMSVVADTGVWVTANFKETQLADIRVGQPVEIEVDAYGGEAVEGTVESISSATGARFALLPPDNATGNFTKVVQRVPVRIRVTKGLGPQRPLRPGMSAVAHVRTR